MKSDTKVYEHGELSKGPSQIVSSVTTKSFDALVQYLKKVYDGISDCRRRSYVPSSTNGVTRDGAFSFLRYCRVLVVCVAFSDVAMRVGVKQLIQVGHMATLTTRICRG